MPPVQKSLLQLHNLFMSIESPHYAPLMLNLLDQQDRSMPHKKTAAMSTQPLNFNLRNWASGKLRQFKRLGNSNPILIKFKSYFNWIFDPYLKPDF